MDLAGAARVIRGGGVVVFPTDTVYGMGCDPHNASAIRRIYSIKGRDPSKPLPILVPSIHHACGIARMNEAAEELAASHWPGPLTLILDVTDMALAASMGLEDSVAVRVPGGPVLQLLDACGMLACTSANHSGEAAPRRAQDVHIECDMLLDGGPAPLGVQSTIVDARDGRIRIIRRGALDI